MRTLNISLAALLAMSTPLAFAQEEEGTEATEGGAEEGAGETEGAAVEEQTGDAVRTTGRDAAPGEVHTVVKDDTLWDLSQRYLGNPWYWPKVWSYNPEIANPHWIYPGNLVRFFPGGEEAPTAVEMGTPVAEAEEPEESVAPSDQIATGLEEEGEVVAVGKLHYEPTKSQRVVLEGFVTQRELDEAGTIEGSWSEADMLSLLDKVYVSFKSRGKARVGDKYVIFKTVTHVRHPVHGGRYGYLTKFLGSMRVIDIDRDGRVTAEIGEAWDEINRGDLVGPYGERLADQVAVRPNDKEMKGYVIGTMVPFLTILGEHHYIVIDKGSADGVQPGNTFTVIRQQDRGGDFVNPSKGQSTEWPVEDVATCMAVDVKDRATTCLVTRSLREIVAGDKVEMRRAGSPPTARR